MRVYLACTVRGDRAGTAAGRVICDRLHHHGHEVLTTHLLADDVEAAESELTEADIYRRDLEWLTSCDVLVAEASGSASRWGTCSVGRVSPGSECSCSTTPHGAAQSRA